MCTPCQGGEVCSSQGFCFEVLTNTGGGTASSGGGTAVGGGSATGGGATNGGGTAQADAGIDGGSVTTDAGTPLRVFVTSSTYVGYFKGINGAADGVTGADNVCNSVAQSASLGGTWLAYITASETVNPATRFTGQGPWVLVGTSTVIFNSKQEVLTSTPLSALNRTQTGAMISGLRPVWTGRDVIYENCVEWANNLASSYGRYGMAGTGMLSKWANSGTAECSSRSSLYCFEQ